LKPPRGIAYCAVVIIAAIYFPLAAQVVVEDEIVTTELTLLDINVESAYNMTLAMGLSLAVPGMGHYYIDKPISAFTYLSIDVASLFGAIVFYSLGNQRENEARSYASLFANIESAPSGEAFWRHVGQFMDAASYNEAIELSRGDVSELYTDPANWWRWGDESQQEEYNDMRQRARTMRVASSFFIGAMVANRIVSTVDLRVFRKKSMTRGVSVGSAIAPDLSGAAIVLTAEF
jgi:hypothetical protein